MFDKIQTKVLELINRIRDERGQTTAEYVAVTAVGVGLAITVIWAVLGGALSAAVGQISAALTTFITTNL